MPESASRLLLAAEGLLIVLPISLVIYFLVLLDFVSLGHMPRSYICVSLIFLPGLISLFFGWCLVLRFLHGGAATLRASPDYTWHFALFGAVLSLIGLASGLIPWELFVIIPPDNEYPTPIPELRGLMIALPLLIPYLHLVLERQFRRNLTIASSGRDG